MSPRSPRTPPTLPEGLLELLLAEAFPFHLLLDGAGRARQVGRSLVKVCPSLEVGADVAPHLRPTTPRGTT